MKSKTIFILILFLFSWFWSLSFWIRYGLKTPAEILPLIENDLSFLGPFAILLDIIILIAIVSFITPHLSRNRHSKGDSCEDEPLDNKSNKLGLQGD